MLLCVGYHVITHCLVTAHYFDLEAFSTVHLGIFLHIAFLILETRNVQVAQMVNVLYMISYHSSNITSAPISWIQTLHMVSHFCKVARLSSLLVYSGGKVHFECTLAISLFELL